jgi:hypothetical protein
MFLAEGQPRMGVEAMIDKNTFVDGVGDHADDSHHVHWTPERRHWTVVMKHFWPALVVPQMPIQRPDSAPESCARRRR